MSIAASSEPLLIIDELKSSDFCNKILLSISGNDMKAYRVTGGAGFIGSHLAEELVRRGHRVRVLDNFLTGKRDNLETFGDKIELLEGDIRDLETCKKAVQGMDFVLHQAALPSIPRSIENPILTNEINVNGTLNILWAALGAKIKRLVYASSSSVYGNNTELPKREDMPCLPISPYGISKLVGEQYCQIFSRLYGLPTVRLRYFNVFGPRQDPLSQYAAVIPQFITWTIRGKPPTIFGDGEQSRDFTFVANVVEANILAAEASGVSGEVFNIACGQRITVNSLVVRIREALGSKVNPRYSDPRPGEILHSYADIAKAERLLNYRVSYPLVDGLQKTVAWYKERV